MTGALPSPPTTLTVSIVVFHPDGAWLERTLASLRIALAFAHDRGALSQATVLLVDNGAQGAESSWSATRTFFEGATEWLTFRILAGHGNVGYGAANNLAFSRAPTSAEYLLTLNPDVVLQPESIFHALSYLAGNSDTALATPVGESPDGEPLYLAKSYPRLFTLALRGFAPAFLRGWFRRRLEFYDRAQIPYDAFLADVRIASGCFMLMRATAFHRIEGFDSAFFLYFEDFDLSYRLTANARAVRLPRCRIVHGGGQASRKGSRHVLMFMRSARRFFAKHGWRW